VILTSALWLTACAGAPAGLKVGVSSAGSESSTPKVPAPPRPPWPDFAQAKTWPEAAPPWTALGHFRDGTRVRVRVLPEVLTAYWALAAESPLPPDARVAAFHESPAGELLGAYVLEKRGGAWSALELDAQGGLVDGDPERCLRCHAQAPVDHLFGLGQRPEPPG
jgi:hypothetical protein